MTDEQWMQRAIEVAQTGIAHGELPYGCVIVDPRGHEVITSAEWTKRLSDATKHAETWALVQGCGGQPHALKGCTLYTTVEPCAMCSFQIRQAEIGRVVFGLRAPLMGGWSHWPILQDEAVFESILGFFEVQFGPPPEVVPDVCAQQILDQWQQWNPVATEVMLKGKVMAL